MHKETPAANVKSSKVKGVLTDRICVISFPMPSKQVVDVYVSRIVSLLQPISKKLYVITGKAQILNSFKENTEYLDIGMAMKFRNEKHLKTSAFYQILTIILIQIKICYLVIKVSRKIDTFIIGIGGSINLLLSILTAKILGKKIVVSALGRGSLGVKFSIKGLSGSLYSSVLSIAENVNYSLADKIIVESNVAVRVLHLEKFASKLVNCPPTFIDTDNFKIVNQIDARENVVGYIGRISYEKGVMNFVQAISRVNEEDENVSFMIGGTGPLSSLVDNEIKRGNLDQKVKRVGWISHDKDLPAYLNNLKILVLPSPSEGLPAIVLEAMACGTPVLVSRVGGLPEIIRDRQNGFLLNNISTDCIARNILEILKSENLNVVSREAREVILKDFTFEAAVRKHMYLLSQLHGNLS